jgi:alpha-glucoside transport system substrate-binding protein
MSPRPPTTGPPAPGPAREPFAPARPAATGMSRRALLGVLGLGAATAACGADVRGTVRVGVVWSGAELATFRRVLRRFARERRWHVSVVSLGDDAGTLLAGRVARGVATDVVIIPQPSLAAANTDVLAELPDLTPRGVAPMWRDLAAPDRVPRGVWFKTTHKSLVWYRPDVFDRLGLVPPEDWAQWKGVRDTCAAAGLPPLSIGAADGWVLTDWFENVLWGLDKVTYEALADGTGSWALSSVERALELLAGVWAPEGTLPGGPSRALLTQFEDSVLDVAVRGRAAMVLGADFVQPVVSRLAPQAPPLKWFRVPRPPGGVPPLIVGGDLAVLLTGAGPGGRELIEWLALPEAAQKWAETGGFVSLLREVDGYPASYGAKLLDQVRSGDAGELGFDLSDRLLGPLSGGDGRGLWRLLQRFLAELGRGGDPALAVEETVARLEAGR